MTQNAPQNPVTTFQRLDLTAARPYTTSEYARRALWEIVQATFVAWSPKKAHAWRRFWLRRFGATMTATSYTKNSTRVRHPWLLTMGQYCTISENVTIYNLGPVAVGDHSVLSQDVYICAGTHDYTQPNLPLIRPPITIGSGVWICAGAFIGPNVTIGHNTIVGARSVVMKDVPEAVIVGGNPAKIVRPRPLPSPLADAHAATVPSRPESEE